MLRPAVQRIILKAPLVVSAGTVLLADAIATAPTVALGTQKLLAAYAGSCLRVRRSSDSTEQDIGFVANELDTASLLTFCGAGDGFITKWYDQSGNARDFIQATAGLQPQIVASGVVKTLNGKPAINFIGANTCRLTNSSTVANVASASAWTEICIVNVTSQVVKVNGYDCPQFFGDTTANFYPLLTYQSVSTPKLGGGHYDTGDEIATNTISLGTNYVGLCKFGSGLISAFINGGTPATRAAANIASTTGTVKIGTSYNNTNPSLDGLMNLLLSYNVALSSANLNTLGGGAGIVPANLSDRAGVTWGSIA